MGVSIKYDDGIHAGLTNEEYQKAPALSFSSLKQFAKTPAQYQAYLKAVRAETPSQRLGTLVHMRTLEPERFDNMVTKIEGNRNSTLVKDMIKAAEEQGKYVCKPDEYDQACRMSDSVRAHSRVKELFSAPGGLAENSIFWTDPETGNPMKCRPDYMIPDAGIILDLKYYSELDMRELERQIHRMKYHWQSALYLSGLSSQVKKPLTQFAHCFIMDDEPYLSRIVVLNDASLDKAVFEMQPHLERFAECRKTNTWPGYPDEVEAAALPDYAW